MLLRFDARTARRALAKRQEFAYFIAELCKRAVIRQVDFRHRISVSGGPKIVNLAVPCAFSRA